MVGVARMQEDRIPKRLLFGCLSHQRSMHGYKLRWRDGIRKALKRFKIDEGRWYEMQRREVYGEYSLEKV